jgi:hypothetical protein
MTTPTADVESVNEPAYVFGRHALSMRRAGFAVLPAAGKSPKMAGFNKWTSAPGPAAVEKWAARDPDADIVYLPGLSRTKRGGKTIIVIDGDDAETCGRILETFGSTPGMVTTRRGKHFLYANPGVDLGRISSLKRFGLEADLKHGNSIVVAPPSLHQNDRTFAYSWEGCDEMVIRDLPDFNVAAFTTLVGREKQGGRGAELYGGSRGLDLNKHLCRQAWACDTFKEMLDVAHTYNHDLAERGNPLLDDDEVVARTKAVWKDVEAGKIKRWHGHASVARTNAAEMKELAARSKNGGDAAMLLMLLRCEHQARALRGETFALDTNAMAGSNTLPGWTIERFRNAIKVLLAANFIKLAAAGRNTRFGRKATRYELSSREPISKLNLGSP